MNDAELDEILDSWKAPAPPASMRANFKAALPARRTRRVFGLPLRWAVALALGAAALAGAGVLVSNGRLSSDAGPWDGGTYLRRTRIVQPSIAKLKWQFAEGRSTGWQWQGSKLVGSAYLYDRWSRVHYGYTWSAEPLGGGQYRFTAQPLDPSVVKEDGTIAEGVHPGPRIVSAGSTFEVDLYASGSERVYDRFELFSHPVGATAPWEPGSAARMLTLTNPRLYIDGRLAAGPGGVVEAKGTTVFVEVPGYGRFVLGLDRGGRAVSSATASVNGGTVEFTFGAKRFRIECTAPIAPEGEHAVFVVRQDVEVSEPAFGGGGTP